MPDHLFLFDIDATLLTTEGRGHRAMMQAGRRLFGPAFSDGGIDFAGNLDPLIMLDLFAHNGVVPSVSSLHDYRARYILELARILAGANTGRPMPGVPELVAALRGLPNVTLGLLTGNIEEGGTLKLAACGLDLTAFPVRVWGDSAWSRDVEGAVATGAKRPTRGDLPPVARLRFEQLHAKSIAPHRITIIGDTPHDVSCALANGCRSLAVATGRHAARDLAACGAHHVLEDLSRTREVIDWLMDSTTPEPACASIRARSARE